MFFKQPKANEEKINSTELNNNLKELKVSHSESLTQLDSPGRMPSLLEGVVMSFNLAFINDGKLEKDSKPKLFYNQGFEAIRECSEHLRLLMLQTEDYLKDDHTEEKYKSERKLMAREFTATYLAEVILLVFQFRQAKEQFGPGAKNAVNEITENLKKVGVILPKKMEDITQLLSKIKFSDSLAMDSETVKSTKDRIEKRFKTGFEIPKEIDLNIAAHAQDVDWKKRGIKPVSQADLPAPIGYPPKKPPSP